MIYFTVLEDPSGNFAEMDSVGDIQMQSSSKQLEAWVWGLGEKSGLKLQVEE